MVNSILKPWPRISQSSFSSLAGVFLFSIRLIMFSSLFLLAFLYTGVQAHSPHRNFVSYRSSLIAPTTTPTPTARILPRDGSLPCQMNNTQGLPPLCLQIPLTANDSNGTVSVTTTAPPTQVPTPPAPSCSMQDQDPDQGITSEYCVCQGSVTLPLLTPSSTAVATESCAYPSLPGSSSQIMPSTGFDSTTTNSGLCLICSEVVNNEDACTTIPTPTCFPEKAQATVQAGSSPVHVGTLTGEPLYTSISSALESICPSVTQTESMTTCSTDSVSIGDIDYVESDSLLDDGKLVVKVLASAYNDTGLRDAMIHSAALTANNSAQGSRCYDQSYEVLVKRSEVEPWSFWTDPMGFKYRSALSKRDRPVPTQEHRNFCNAACFAGVQYYDKFWRMAENPGSTAYIDASWEFETGPGGDFDCEFLEGLIDALAIVAPEFTVGDVELGEEIGAICAEAMDHS